MADVSNEQQTETPIAKIADENEALPKVANADDVVEVAKEVVTDVVESTDNSKDEAVVDVTEADATKPEAEAPAVENGEAEAEAEEETDGADVGKRKSEAVVDEDVSAEKKAKIDETPAEAKEVVEENGEAEVAVEA